MRFNSEYWNVWNPRHLRLGLFAAGAPAAPGGGGAPASPAAPATPAAPSPASPGPGVPPASPTGTGVPPVTPTGQPTPTDPNAPNLEVLRTSHAKLAELGGVEKVSAAVATYQKTYDGAKALATQLGYTPESFEEAWKTDAAEVIAHLKSEARTAEDRSNSDPATLVDRKLAPVTSYIQQQMAKTANQGLESEFNTMFSNHALFKDKVVPAEVKSAIQDHFADLIKWDKGALDKCLHGDFSGAKVHFEKALANMTQFSNKWMEWMSGGQPGTPPGTPPAPNRPGAPRGVDGQFVSADGKPKGNFLNALAEGEEDAFQHLSTTRR